MLFGKKHVLSGSYILPKLCYFQIKSLKIEVDCRIRILKIIYYFTNLDGEYLQNLELPFRKMRITKNGSQILFGFINDVLTKF